MTIAINFVSWCMIKVVSALEAPFPWTPGTRHSPSELNWPPKGVELRVNFNLNTQQQPASGEVDPLECLSKVVDAHRGVEVVMHYILYDGVPLLSKSMTVSCPNCTTTDDIVVRGTTVETLAVNAGFGEYFTHGSQKPGADWGGAATVMTSGPSPLLLAKTDQAHSAACGWVDDYPNSKNPIVPNMKDQGATEPTLNCSYTNHGPGAHVNKRESFVSFRSLLLATDSTDIGRQSLMRHRVTQVCY